jgi:PIN domain nuclease of toxin-antitoxin system
LKLLLDTHIWIWSVGDKARLRPPVLAALANSENELWLSPISVWELLILVEKGRVVLDRDVEEWIGEALKAAQIHEAPLTREVALATRELRLTHRDPADAFITATAKVFDLTLVTSDARLIATTGLSILPNR